MTATKPQSNPQTTGPTITAEKLAEYSGVSARQLRNIAAKGYFPPPEHGLYQAGPSLVGMIKYLKEKCAKKNDSLKREQEALTKARRQMVEEELLEFRGDYVLKAEIGQWIRNVGLNQRALLLRKLEQELAPKLAGKTTVEILDLIRGATDDVIRCYREGTARWATEEPK